MTIPMHLAPLRLLVTFVLTAMPAWAADIADAELTPGEREVRRHFPADAARVTTIRLWPGAAPDDPRPIGAESVGEGARSSHINNVAQPSVTVVHGMDMLLTWNCTHIHNIAISRQIGQICTRAGFQLPAICTPFDLLKP